MKNLRSSGRFCVLTLILFTCYLTSRATTGCSRVDFRIAQGLDATPSNPFPVPSYAVSDLNGDGTVDIVVTDARNNKVLVLLNDGSGHFEAPKSIGVGSAPRAVAIGDFNGDSNSDLIVANYDSNNISVILGTGGGQFAPPASVSVSNGPIASHLGQS